MEMFFAVIGFLAVVGLLLFEARKLERRIENLDLEFQSRVKQWEREHERESDENNKKVSSRSFELLDEEGKTRARLDTSAGMYPEHQPRLLFYDGNGVSRASLSLDYRGYPELYLTNLDENRSPYIGRGGKSTCRIHLGFDDEGYPQLEMYDNFENAAFEPAIKLGIQRAEWIGGLGETTFQNQSKSAGLGCVAWLGGKEEFRFFGARAVSTVESESGETA